MDIGRTIDRTGTARVSPRRVASASAGSGADRDERHEPRGEAMSEGRDIVLLEPVSPRESSGHYRAGAPFIAQLIANRETTPAGGERRASRANGAVAPRANEAYGRAGRLSTAIEPGFLLARSC
ncbi:hypothetical protein [Methylobrevis pamukkalensis]|uniref:hypothetical protein n=1 Tax=Methylobrevis pamukkalensis TaxID=1439726 RepID=UPI00114CC26D|nr:hypothetical protein [Methylobrevis pamukkalensis]